MSEVITKQLATFFTPDEVRLIFENSVRYFEAAQSIDGLTMPKPLSHTDTHLVFEKLPGLQGTLENSWFRGEKWDAELCCKIGYYLGKLHKAQGNLFEKIHIHGDFVPHNVVIRETDVVFFDCEPPGRHSDFMHFYLNYNYVDLASFIFFIFISHSFKRPWQFMRNKRPFVASLLKGYETGASFVCDKKTLRLYIQQEMYKWYKDCPRHFAIKFAEYGIIRTMMFMQMTLYRVLS